MQLILNSLKRAIENKSSFEWIFFNDSLKMLFDKFSLQTIKLDKKWLKSASKSKDVTKIQKIE